MMCPKLPGDVCVPGDSGCQAGFQIFIPMNRDGDYFGLTWFAEDMVTASDALQHPAVLLQQPAHFLAGNRLHKLSSVTSISGCGWRPSSRITSK